MAPPSPTLPTQLHEQRTRLQARQHAVRQLEASRSTLLRLLTPEESPTAASATSASTPFWRSARWFLRRWWRGHPMNGVVTVAEALARHKLRPAADNHPLALLGVAALAGGVVAFAVPRHSSRWLWPLVAVEVRRLAAGLFETRAVS